MANRLTRIVTRHGDGGETGLADGTRRAKDDPRIEALGAVDELNAVLGLVRAALEDSQADRLLLELQHDLFDLGAELSQPGKALLDAGFPARLERHAEALNQALPPLKEFILPGGNEPLSRLHLARTVARRAERALVRLDRAEALNPHSLAWINRLSDLLFILGRSLAARQGWDEVYWEAERDRGQR